MSQPVTVLHVDDDPALLRLVEEIFAEEAPGLDYVSAEGSDDALEELEDVRAPVVLLLDRRLPGADPWAFIEDVAEELERVTVLTFVLSGSEDPQDVAEAYANGAVGYIEKPMDTSGFREIADMLDRFTDIVTFPGERS